jgi:hypothetical protein
MNRNVPKNPAAVELGRLGGKARARNLNPEMRAVIAQLGAASRWGCRVCGSTKTGHPSDHEWLGSNAP